MSGTVIAFPGKDDETPWINGKARCIGCGHEWQAVTPAGKPQGLECPECHALKGVIRGMAIAEGEIFICDCGNDLYFIYRNGMLCANCGVWAKGF